MWTNLRRWFVEANEGGPMMHQEAEVQEQGGEGAVLGLPDEIYGAIFVCLDAWDLFRYSNCSMAAAQTVIVYTLEYMQPDVASERAIVDKEIVEITESQSEVGRRSTRAGASRRLERKFQVESLKLWFSSMRSDSHTGAFSQSEANAEIRRGGRPSKFCLPSAVSEIVRVSQEEKAFSLSGTISSETEFASVPCLTDALAAFEDSEAFREFGPPRMVPSSSSQTELGPSQMAAPNWRETASGREGEQEPAQVFERPPGGLTERFVMRAESTGCQIPPAFTCLCCDVSMRFPPLVNYSSRWPSETAGHPGPQRVGGMGSSGVGPDAAWGAWVSDGCGHGVTVRAWMGEGEGGERVRRIERLLEEKTRLDMAVEDHAATVREVNSAADAVQRSSDFIHVTADELREAVGRVQTLCASLDPKSNALLERCKSVSAKSRDVRKREFFIALLCCAHLRAPSPSPSPSDSPSVNESEGLPPRTVSVSNSEEAREPSRDEEDQSLSLPEKAEKESLKGSGDGKCEEETGKLAVESLKKEEEEDDGVEGKNPLAVDEADKRKCRKALQHALWEQAGRSLERVRRGRGTYTQQDPRQTLFAPKLHNVSTWLTQGFVGSAHQGKFGGALDALAYASACGYVKGTFRKFGRELLTGSIPPAEASDPLRTATEAEVEVIYGQRHPVLLSSAAGQPPTASPSEDRSPAGNALQAPESTAQSIEQEIAQTEAQASESASEKDVQDAKPHTGIETDQPVIQQTEASRRVCERMKEEQNGFQRDS
uniref:F-box domain-containing protein n=1 Tax=Chromera velia CCMP2878 TaxID=1169474 RepID=A0A0G4GS08_9ALVE|eukprot:Cvel_5122.t1-p1 / transcript=Cvel_5122.t1 / gene=Cvel_5122 / organism=Chromera_velia_CCMP2878 / gene_product=hypothetical protein / transcript_product=hypothetical protein / location=Cvel_scaffold234:45049-49342(-) / protein_length=768 / sequence_SO=supercontig / SO=protein_coding / is_pseudo=false